MFNLIEKNNILKVSLIFIILICSIVFLYSSHYKKNFGGGDQLEWYKESLERNTVAKILNFQYFSNRLTASTWFNPAQLVLWRYMAVNYGQQAFPWYSLSILIHLTNVVIVFFLANIFIKNKLFSFLAALSFAVFYLNFLTVGWLAAGIAHGLTASFILTVIFLAIKYFQTKNKIFCLFSLLIFFLGTFFKEIVVFAIPILAAYYLIFQRDKIFKFIKTDLVFIPYLILSLPIILITSIRINKSALINTFGGVNFGIHMFYRFVEFLNYLISIVPVPFGMQMAIAMFVFIFLPTSIYFGIKDKKIMFILFWLILSISIYIYQNFRDIYSLARYLYLPSAAWFTLLYYVASNIKNLKLKIISTLFLINYTVVFNILLILTKKV